MSFYDDDESIYGLIAQTKSASAKGTSYKSKFNPKAPPSFSTFGFRGTSKIVGNVEGHMEEADAETHPAKKANGTFGRSVGAQINPKQFLKKTDQTLPPTAAIEKKKLVRNPPVPTNEDKPVMGLKTDKNFVVANAVENILAVPKKTSDDQQTRAVDKGGYGKVPAYIQRTKKEIATQQAHTMAAKEQNMSLERVSDMKELEEEDAIDLREGLKQRWEVLNKQFATMSFNLETKSQLKRKEQLETQLHQLETAMAKLNKRHIYVCADK